MKLYEMVKDWVVRDRKRETRMDAIAVAAVVATGKGAEEKFMQKCESAKQICRNECLCKWLLHVCVRHWEKVKPRFVPYEKFWALHLRCGKVYIKHLPLHRFDHSLLLLCWIFFLFSSSPPVCSLMNVRVYVYQVISLLFSHPPGNWMRMKLICFVSIVTKTCSNINAKWTIDTHTREHSAVEIVKIAHRLFATVVRSIFCCCHGFLPFWHNYDCNKGRSKGTLDRLTRTN